MHCDRSGHRTCLSHCVILAIFLLLHSAHTLYASSLTCPDPQRDPSTSTLSLLSRDKAGAPSSQKSNTSRFANDRIIVKFRESVTESADLVHADSLAFAQAALAGGDELDELNRKFGVKKYTPLFQVGADGEKEKGFRQTRAERKALFSRLFNASRENLPGVRREPRLAGWFPIYHTSMSCRCLRERMSLLRARGTQPTPTSNMPFQATSCSLNRFPTTPSFHHGGHGAIRLTTCGH